MSDALFPSLRNTTTSILGKYTITRHVELPEHYSAPLITQDDTVEVAETGGVPTFEVCDADSNVVIRGDVAYHNAATKESIHGKIVYLGVDYYVSAYARTSDDSVHICGFATSSAATDDDGGQCDGNRPR